MEQGDHAADLVQDRLGAGRLRRGGGVGGLRGEVGQRRVPPVVGESALEQEGLGEGGVDGQQLDGGHAQRAQVLDRGRMGHTRVGAAQLGRHAGHVVGEPLDMGLVDDGAAVGHPGAGHDRELLTGDHAEGDASGGVELGGSEWHEGGGEVVVDGVRVQLGPQDRLAVQSARVGIEKKLAGIEQQALGGVPRPVDAVAVALPGAHAGHMGVPDAEPRAAQADPALGDDPARGVRLDQAQIDGGRVRRGEGEIGAVPGQGGAQADAVRRVGGCSGGRLRL